MNLTNETLKKSFCVRYKKKSINYHSGAINLCFKVCYHTFSFWLAHLSCAHVLLLMIASHFFSAVDLLLEKTKLLFLIVFNMFIFYQIKMIKMIVFHQLPAPDKNTEVVSL